MMKLLSCNFNMDTNWVEAKFADGAVLAIDCLAIEDEYGNTPAQRAELDWLRYNKPLEYAQLVLNELNNNFSGRNEVVDRLCCCPPLIIDDFGMERGTEYALEQIYNIIDSRYRSRKPLIVTTNLTLDDIRHPQDTAHARIYDRLLEMCVPVSCIGVSFRKETTQEKLERLKELIG